MRRGDAARRQKLPLVLPVAEAEVALVGALLLIGIFLAGVLLGVVLTLAFSMFIYAGVDGGRKGWP